MVGISDLIQTMGAIIIFSLILLTANRMVLSNSLQEVESEAEGIAVTLAQGVIEEAQTKAFDANTNTADINSIPKDIPGGFSSCGPSPSEEGHREMFNDFDDYDDYTEAVDTELGDNSFTISAEVFYVQPPDYDTKTSTQTSFKKMRVTVSSDYLRNNRKIKLSYLRRYYKTTN